MNHTKRNINPILIISFLFLILLNSCQALKYKKVDAKEFPPEPDKRIKKNIEEGRGFKFFGGTKKNAGEFDFASSNPLWRASLDTIDFMPLLSVDYGGGVIITDWYDNNQKDNESIKLVIKFLSNDVRADALDIKIFKKKCKNISDCKTSSSESTLNNEIKLAILKKAALYQKQRIKKNTKEYKVITPGEAGRSTTN